MFLPVMLLIMHIVMFVYEAKSRKIDGLAEVNSNFNFMILSVSYPGQLDEGMLHNL